MLDDIGSKVAIEQISLPVSWLLETSPGNYQGGYLLREPLIDADLANKLMKAIIAKGLCDPGANGPGTRLTRLPLGINSKYTPPFRCRMVVWSPDVRYSVEELIKGLQIEMAASQQLPSPVSRAEQQSQLDHVTVWNPPAKTNRVLAALHHRGLYKEPLGGGRHDISCPWVIEHTNATNRGTAYFEPDDNWPVGGFKCQHAHCTNRHLRDLLSYLGIDVSAAQMRPTIRVIKGQVSRVVDAAERILVTTQKYYQIGGLIVCVNTDPGSLETRVLEVSLSTLVLALSELAIWEKINSQGNWVQIDPPNYYAGLLLGSTDYRQLPILRGLARQPYFRENGTVMTAPGYDPSSQTYGVFDPNRFDIPDTPTPADAKAAVSILEELLTEFSFASPSDLAAALSALLTAAIRPALSSAPMFHVRAH